MQNVKIISVSKTPVCKNNNNNKNYSGKTEHVCKCVFGPQVFQYFISRVREKLHIVLCMSPVGDAFRSRCRMFPSLVNCCTIDWFVQVC